MYRDDEYCLHGLTLSFDVVNKKAFELTKVKPNSSTMCMHGETEIAMLEKSEYAGKIRVYGIVKVRSLFSVIIPAFPLVISTIHTSRVCLV